MKMIKSIVEVQLTVYTPYHDGWEDDSDSVWDGCFKYFNPEVHGEFVMFDILEQEVIDYD